MQSSNLQDALSPQGDNAKKIFWGLGSWIKLLILAWIATVSNAVACTSTGALTSFSPNLNGAYYIVGDVDFYVGDANVDANFRLTTCCYYRYKAIDGSNLANYHPLYTRNGNSIVWMANTGTNSVAFWIGGLSVNNPDWGFNSNGYETLYF